MQIHILKKIIELKKLKKEFSVITNLKNSKNYIFIDQIIHQDLQQYKNEINDAYISWKDGIIKGTELFVKNYHRPIKVVIVGAVHISQFFGIFFIQTNYGYAITFHYDTFRCCTCYR